MNTLEYRDHVLILVDQTALPLRTALVECREYSQVAEAIRSLRVRGAPAIGLAAAYGLVLAARSIEARGLSRDTAVSQLREAAEVLRSTRPTAVNLFWALSRMWSVVESHPGTAPEELTALLLTEANRMLHEDEEANRRMGEFGADLIPDGARVLTHCNAGALATGAYGTALGAIRTAHEAGKRIHVWVDETRPLLQGARLTAWELQQIGIPCTLITDSMAAHFMARGEIDMAMVGADRIVANGDAANKIGTYSVAVLAHAHGLPMYFVAPVSTVDLATPSGDAITIEERDAGEVTGFQGLRTAPPGIQVANPAFDVTPARLITAIVTDYGVARAPLAESLHRLVPPKQRPPESMSTVVAAADGA